jgi:hypothetical protein
LSFEHGWLQVELMDVTDDMKFSAEYWTYWTRALLVLFLKIKFCDNYFQ